MQKSLFNVDQKTRRSSNYELKAMISLKEAVHPNGSCTSLFEVKRVFDSVIARWPDKTNTSVKSWYDLDFPIVGLDKAPDYSRLELWHLDSQHNKGRLVAIITKNPATNE